MYDHSPDGVLFTSPDGPVLAANPAACQILGRTEAEICALGRQRLTDGSDDRWNQMLAERARSGSASGTARMIRDVTERLALERELVEMSARLRELMLTDGLTGLRNRRGFLVVGRQLLEVADRQGALVHLLYIDVDNLKQLNDTRGHTAGDLALRTVAQALASVLRRADTAARIGGAEYDARGVRIRQLRRRGRVGGGRRR
jgi:predicted signal transduction protein with EAL and GGDEF domain